MSSIPGRMVLGFFLCVLGLRACQRAQRSMGRNIESAGLIVIADARATKPEDRLVLTVREFLKGTAPRTITMKRPYCPYVPEGNGLALLLSPDWSSNDFPVIEVYTEAAPIARLRELVPIYRLPSERQRLEALKSDPRYREQLFDDLREMRERGNYPIATDLYPNLDKAGRLKLIELMGYIGDARGVPVLLLQAMASDAAEVRDAAQAALAFHFPDAAPAGAFDLHSAPENAMQKAFRLAKEGHPREARPLLLAVAADNRESEYIRMWAALELVPQLDAQRKNALRRSMLPLLTRMVKEGNYLQLADAVRILRELRHRENLELLVGAIGRKDNLEEKTPFQATMALRELGSAERPRAVALLAALVEGREKEQGYRMVGGTPAAPLLSLAWLSGEPEFRRSIEIRGDYLRSVWGASLQPDEGRFLASVLRKSGNLPPEAIKWIAMRLGDLRDARAIDSLVALLGSAQWSLMESSKKALIRIGGDPVAAAAGRLLAGSGGGAAREAALTIVYALKGARALPQIRAALADEALRTTALGLLARVGTEEDLKVLIPMSDFWTGDRNHHYWAMQAVGEIRGRYRRLQAGR
jgi:HEAT repeat protein